jgi:hypothetical protein
MEPQDRVPRVAGIERAQRDLVDQKRGLAGARATDQKRVALPSPQQHLRFPLFVGGFEFGYGLLRRTVFAVHFVPSVCFR